MGIILRDKGYEEKEKFHNHLWDIPAMFILIISTTDKKLKRKYGLILVVCVTSLVGLFISGFTLIGGREDYQCSRFKRHLDHEVRGLVTKKFKDKENRNWDTAEINSNGEIIRELETLLYHLELYNVLQPGDSIIKAKGSNVTKLVHGDSTRLFKATLNKVCE